MDSCSKCMRTRTLSVYEQIVRLTDQVCLEHLNEEYALLARSTADPRLAGIHAL